MPYRLTLWLAVLLIGCFAPALWAASPAPHSADNDAEVLQQLIERTLAVEIHEWLGHNVQIAASRAHVTREIRLGHDGGFFGPFWSFYLEKLLEEEGYFDDRLDYLTALIKTRMGDHYRLKAFNDQLLTYGDLPFPMIRKLMFLD